MSKQMTLHLKTQRDQPYGSERRCCEMCGDMLVARPDAFWLANTWTDNPADYRVWEDGEANLPGRMVPCLPQPTAKGGTT